jgi:hypothetical protein
VSQSGPELDGAEQRAREQPFELAERAGVERGDL